VTGQGWNNNVTVSGGVPLQGRQSMTFLNGITPRWFATFGIPLVAGRIFTDRDQKGTAPVAIVNQAFARRFLNGASPVGHTVQRRGPVGKPGAPSEIVGVVADAVYRSL